MSGPKRALIVVAALALLAVPLQAVPDINLKLPTIAPSGSPWHKALLDMGAVFARDTAGRVKITVFPNSALGGEPSVVRNLRNDQVQASLLMLSGLALLDESFNALGIPFFFKDDAEARAVIEALTPTIESRLSAKGFHLLSWTNGGWVQVFSKNPLKSLQDLKNAKLWTSDGDTRMVSWYKANGFHPVPADANAIGGMMSTGVIDATPTPAYGALLLNLHKDAKFMMDVHVAPLLGALVINNKSWNAISKEDQAKVTAAAKAFEKSTSIEIPAKDTAAVGEMQKRGLTVTTLDPKARAEFDAAVDKLMASMRGDQVPVDVFDAAKNARDAFRKKR